MSYPSGYPFYGQTLGILVFSTITPRIPGDAGHAGSFSFPVCYEVVKGGFADLIEGSETIRTDLLKAVEALKNKGIPAVLGDCGLMSLYQDILGASCGIPVAASSLCQIPMVWQLIGRKGTIGIVTGHSELLGEKHLLASGWTEDISLSIQGMENESHFNEVVIEGKGNLSVEEMRRDVLSACKNLKEKNKELRAIIIECSNLATYSRDVYSMLKVPVFDTMSAANLLSYSVSPPSYIDKFDR